MLFSYEWLKDYVADLPEAEKLLEQLTLHSVEVEEVIPSSHLGNVVVGELLSVEDHPNADTLHIGLFDVGEEKPRQVVFGDKAVLNVGDKLPIALAPTVITGGVKIKKAKLRGVLSEGMCCLNSELQILDRSNNVHFFDSTVENGTPVPELIPSNGSLIDIDNKSMTHRADLFSHVNMAREIAAVFNLPFQYPKLKPLPTGLPELQVTIKDTEGCPRYMGAMLEVEVGEAPDFIQRRLQASGVKVINNVVDITNYVMLELGEPMHAFDADVLDGEQIIVRRAKKGEAILTLDKDTKKLDESILVIADEKSPIAVAGVIGGLETGVTSETKRIVLEAATFEPLTVRKAGASIGVRTDSLLRWEKGLVPEFAQHGMARALELLQQYANAKVVAFSDIYPEPKTNQPVNVHLRQLTRLAGMEFTVAQVQEYLGRLECTTAVTEEGESTVITVTPPWFRKDLHIEEDIIEEVVRLHGVNNIPKQQLRAVLEVPQGEADLKTIRRVRELLARAGGYEVQNHSFYGAELLEKVGYNPEKEHLVIANPLSEDLKYLRVNLLPRILESVAFNAHNVTSATLFEIGHVYFSDREVRQLGIAVFGGSEPYRRLRGTVDALMHGMGIEWTGEVIHKTAECQFWGMYEADTALRMDVHSDIAGTLGMVDPAVLRRMDIHTPVAFATISIAQLTTHADTSTAMQPISHYPAIELDLSIIVDESVLWSEIETVVRSEAGEELQSVELFDIYHGKELGTGKKSLAFRMVMQSHIKTLEMLHLEQWRDEQLMKRLSKKLGAELRGT